MKNKILNFLKTFRRETPAAGGCCAPPSCSAAVILTCTRCGKRYETDKPCTGKRGDGKPRRICYECAYKALMRFLDEPDEPPNGRTEARLPEADAGKDT